MIERILDVRHQTLYRYEDSVEIAQYMGYLQPLSDAHQTVSEFSLTVEPRPAHRSSSVDGFGNVRHFFSLASSHDTLVVRAHSRVTLSARFEGINVAAGPSWEEVRDGLRFRQHDKTPRAVEFLHHSPHVALGPDLAVYASQSFTEGRILVDAALDLMHRIHADFEYCPDSTVVSTPAMEVFQNRRGVCQDFAHVMIGCLRSLGLPARYVSGYLVSAPLEHDEHLVGSEASHAWVSVYCPDAGVPHDWLDLDPTNDLVPGRSHVRLATGRDYSDVPPLHGIIRGGGDHTLEVGVRVTPLA